MALMLSFYEGNHPAENNDGLLPGSWLESKLAQVLIL